MNGVPFRKHSKWENLIKIHIIVTIGIAKKIEDTYFNENFYLLYQRDIYLKIITKKYCITKVFNYKINAYET